MFLSFLRFRRDAEDAGEKSASLLDMVLSLRIQTRPRGLLFGLLCSLLKWGTLNINLFETGIERLKKNETKMDTNASVMCVTIILQRYCAKRFDSCLINLTEIGFFHSQAREIKTGNQQLMSIRLREVNLPHLRMAYLVELMLVNL